MHPPVRDTMSKIEVSRAVAQQAVQWLGVGLEEAQRTGSMPVELTSAEKRGRPQLRPLKRLEVIPDEVWQHERRELHFTKGAHATHSLKKTGAFWFCEVCGCHGSQKLVALSEPCTRATTPSRKYLLKRLLAGCHPRTGDFLGDVERAEPVDELLFSATRRRGHSVLSGFHSGGAVMASGVCVDPQRPLLHPRVCARTLTNGTAETWPK